MAELGFAEELAPAVDDEAEAGPLEMDFLIAPSAAAPASVALLNFLASNLSKRLDLAAGLAAVEVCGALQLWSDGKRWEGQNWDLHFYS